MPLLMFAILIIVCLPLCNFLVCCTYCAQTFALINVAGCARFPSRLFSNAACRLLSQASPGAPDAPPGVNTMAY